MPKYGRVTKHLSTPISFEIMLHEKKTCTKNAVPTNSEQTNVCGEHPIDGLLNKQNFNAN